MRFRRRQHGAGGVDGAFDAVGDLEPFGLALVVDDADELTGDAFGPEFVVEREVERDRSRPVLRERELLVLFGADLDVHTGDGSIRNELQVATDSGGEANRRTIRGKLNDGGKVLRVRTGDGSVRLRES